MIISELKEEIHAHASRKIAIDSNRYHKEEIKCLGVKTAIVRKISAKYFRKIKKKARKKLSTVVKSL